MSRAILLKAKRKDNGEWVEGGYFSEPYTDKKFIICWNSFGLGFNEFIEVLPDTICQYTGLTDKNGKKIWENDIAYIRSSGLSGYGVVKYQNGNLVLVDEKRKRTYSLYGEWKIRKDGNIFDNAELLEVER